MLIKTCGFCGKEQPMNMKYCNNCNYEFGVWDEVFAIARGKKEE